MADNYEISNTLESLQKAVEIIDNNVHELKVKLQAPHLYLDPFKIEISNNGLNKVHKEVVTFRDSVLALLKQVKEETEDWQQLNEKIIMSNLAMRNELKQIEINLEQYGYIPQGDLKILEARGQSGVEQHISPVNSVVKKLENNICIEDDDNCEDTSVTPRLCRKSKSQQSIEKDSKHNLLETINVNQTSKVLSDYEEEYGLKGNETVEGSNFKVEKNCEVSADLKQKGVEENNLEAGANKEMDCVEESSAGCGKYSVYYYELMKAKKDIDQSNIVREEIRKNEHHENATTESGKFSVYYYELMKKNGRNQTD